MVTENDRTHFTIVVKDADGDGATFLTGNGAGTTVKNWPSRDFSIDISGLSF